jgi:hypothetical protein
VGRPQTAVQGRPAQGTQLGDDIPQRQLGVGGGTGSDQQGTGLGGSEHVEVAVVGTATPWPHRHNAGSFDRLRTAITGTFTAAEVGRDRGEQSYQSP